MVNMELVLILPVLLCIREDRCSLYLALSVDLLWYLLCGGEHFESITLLGEAITLLWK